MKKYFFFSFFFPYTFLQDNLSWTNDNSGVSLSGSTNNTIATVTGANALVGEGNLTFDGTSLSIVGDYSVKNPSDASYITHTFASNFAKIDLENVDQRARADLENIDQRARKDVALLDQRAREDIQKVDKKARRDIAILDKRAREDHELLRKVRRAKGLN